MHVDPPKTSFIIALQEHLALNYTLMPPRTTNCPLSPGSHFPIDNVSIRHPQQYLFSEWGSTERLTATTHVSLETAHRTPQGALSTLPQPTSLRFYFVLSHGQQTKLLCRLVLPCDFYTHHSVRRMRCTPLSVSTTGDISIFPRPLTTSSKS